MVNLKYRIIYMYGQGLLPAFNSMKRQNLLALVILLKIAE